MKLNKLLIAAASALTAQAAFAGVYPQCPFDITAASVTHETDAATGLPWGWRRGVQAELIEQRLRADADTMSLNGRGNGHLVPGLSGGDRRRVHYIALPTNLLISAHPDYLMFHRLIPHSAGRATVECSWHFPQSVAAAQDFDPSFASDFWDLTNIQDFAACESVTRGMRSGGFRRAMSAPRPRMS